MFAKVAAVFRSFLPCERRERAVERGFQSVVQIRRKEEHVRCIQRNLHSLQMKIDGPNAGKWECKFCYTLFDEVEK